MSELMIEIERDALDLVEEFCAEHSQHAKLEPLDHHIGIELVTVIIENTPDLLVGIAALITAIKAKGSTVRITNEEGDVVDPETVSPQ